MNPLHPTQPTKPSSQRLIWLIAGGAFLAILSSALFVMYDEPQQTAEIPPPPMNEDGTPAISIISAPPIKLPNDVGHCEVVELNGQQVVKFRINAQGDEVVFDSITGKVVFIRTKDGIAPTNDFPMPPAEQTAPQPKMVEPTMKTWFESSPM